MKLDKYTEDMLWENIFNVYSDAEQLEIIKHLVELLKGTQDIYMEDNSIEEIYSLGLERILNIIEEIRDKEKVYFLLEDIADGKEDTTYEIETGFEDFHKYVDLGNTKKECLQIFMMCYMSNPTLEELEEWTLQDILNYIEETDEYYKEDLEHIIKCVKIIESRKEEQ